MTAREKILCSSAWYFTTDRADSPPAASVTHVWTIGGEIRRMEISPNRGRSACPGSTGKPRGW
jgi:hypothetical protein